VCIRTHPHHRASIQKAKNSLNYQDLIGTGMAAQAGSKRRRKDPQEDAAQAESVNCLSQRLAEMPSPLNFKRVRTGNAAEAMDPMEGVDGDVHDGQGIWEQQDRSDVSNHFTQGSVMSQVCIFSKRHSDMKA
jgi:hypothetical protein